MLSYESPIPKVLWDPVALKEKTISARILAALRLLGSDDIKAEYAPIAIHAAQEALKRDYMWFSSKEKSTTTSEHEGDIIVSLTYLQSLRTHSQQNSEFRSYYSEPNDIGGISVTFKGPDRWSNSMDVKVHLSAHAIASLVSQYRDYQILPGNPPRFVSRNPEDGADG